MRANHLLPFKLVTAVLFLITGITHAQEVKKDQFETSSGALNIYHVGHASLYFEIDSKVIHVDPFGKMGDYSSMPKADLILITHAHGDHLDPEAIKLISKENTKIFLNQASYNSLEKGKVLANGDNTEFAGFPIKAVPAYNIEHTRDSGEPFHPKGRDNGYVIDFGDTSVYVAGDTENIPEMKNLYDIDIAFLPMNLPYTMDAEMCKKAALIVQPKVLFPYHYKMGESDPEKLAQLMENVSEIELRFRQ
ncbi:MBL fold metallo-hydrolase [Marinilabilia rubra]|uniref:Metal-dependent hydrolase n=1 Tax=Marinilabilia rubra TaxID=2162893 RepID=A0A2U2BCL9_9BACT|nr:MBL fold metallo-hydrolase [Marinilabilia rubra]PWE00808.1 metal-dependent hydrolase [Marinilabilia rubra]